MYGIHRHIDIDSRNIITIRLTITLLDSSHKQITYSSAMLQNIQNKVNDNRHLQTLQPGVIDTIRKPRINKRRIGTSHRSIPINCRSSISSNLLFVNMTDIHNQEAANNMRIATLNTWSVKNRDHLIVQQLLETDADIAVITETCLKDTDIDKAWLNQSELRQSNYDILLQKRPGPKKGGGIALMCKHQYRNDITLLEKTTTSTMEYLIRTHPQKQILPHHWPIPPPPDTNNQMTTSTFVDEITSLLTERIPNLSNIIILGDFNISTMETTSADETIFNNIMAALGLEQHIQGPTHKLGNTLDLIFTQLYGEVKVTNATTHGFISDYCMVSIDLQLHKLRYPRQKKIIRDKTRITAKALLTNFTTLILDSNDSLDQACNKLNTELHNALEKTAPLKTIICSDKPRQPWFNKYVRGQQKIVRSRQRAWSRYRQPNHWMAYTKERNIYTQLMVYHKQQMITKKILDCGRDSKQLFSMVNAITNNEQINTLPDNKTLGEMANYFANFFIRKIQTVRDELSSANEFKPQVNNIPQLNQFTPLKIEEVQKEIMSMKSKSCELDTIPTNLLKELLPSCIGTITHIVNTSLT